MESRKSGMAVGFDAYRGYLTVLAKAQVGPRLRGKVDPSDLVQQALLKACQHWDGFRGDDRGIRAWLRSILANVITDHVRKFGDPAGGDRERSLEATLEGSSLRLERLLQDDGSSPSHRAGRNERALLLASALARLPEEQRIAVDLRHLRGASLEAISGRMNKSIPAVAGLLRRGLEALRADLRNLA